MRLVDYGCFDLKWSIKKTIELGTPTLSKKQSEYTTQLHILFII